MINIRMYRVMGDLVVEMSAVLNHDPNGDPIPERAVFVGREYFDATGSLNTEDLSEATYRVASRAERAVGEEFAGWHGLI